MIKKIEKRNWAETVRYGCWWRCVWLFAVGVEEMHDISLPSLHKRNKWQWFHFNGWAKSGPLWNSGQTNIVFITIEKHHFPRYFTLKLCGFSHKLISFVQQILNYQHLCPLLLVMMLQTFPSTRIFHIRKKPRNNFCYYESKIGWQFSDEWISNSW